MGIILNEEKLNKIIKSVLSEMINEEEMILSVHLSKLKDKIIEISNEINGQMAVDYSSTWQIPYTIEWTVKENGNKLFVKRVEKSTDVYNNKHEKYSYKPNVQKWIVTDNNWKEKWSDKFYGGIKELLSDDLRNVRRYNK